MDIEEDYFSQLFSDDTRGGYEFVLWKYQCKWVFV